MGFACWLLLRTYMCCFYFVSYKLWSIFEWCKFWRKLGWKLLNLTFGAPKSNRTTVVTADHPVILMPSEQASLCWSCKRTGDALSRSWNCPTTLWIGMWRQPINLELITTVNLSITSICYCCILLALDRLEPSHPACKAVTWRLRQIWP